MSGSRAVLVAGSSPIVLEQDLDGATLTWHAPGMSAEPRFLIRGVATLLALSGVPLFLFSVVLVVLSPQAEGGLGTVGAMWLMVGVLVALGTLVAWGVTSLEKPHALRVDGSGLLVDQERVALRGPPDIRITRRSVAEEFLGLQPGRLDRQGAGRKDRVVQLVTPSGPRVLADQLSQRRAEVIRDTLHRLLERTGSGVEDPQGLAAVERMRRGAGARVPSPEAAPRVANGIASPVQRVEVDDDGTA